MKGIDLSPLFDGLNKNNSSANFINFNDYASIKNGSYGKLMKAVYSESSKADSTDKTGNKNSNKVNRTDSTGLSKVKKEADSLKEAAALLKDDKFWKEVSANKDSAKMTEAVEGFAKKYNAAMKASNAVLSSEVSKNADTMTSLSKVMSSALSKAGISFDKDGMMEVDSKALKEADIDTVKSMFAGENSYGSEIGNKAADMAKAAVMSTGLYNGDGSINSSMSAIFNSWV